MDGHHQASTALVLLGANFRPPLPPAEPPPPTHTHRIIHPVQISEQTGEKDNKQLGVWTNRVNSCLQSGDPAIRWVGLTLLLETTARCDPDTFATNCSVWTGAAAKLIDSDRGPSAVLAMECTIASTLILTHLFASARLAPAPSSQCAAPAWYACELILACFRLCCVQIGASGMRKTLSFSCRDPELRRDHAKFHLPPIINSLLALASAGGETAAATAAATATDAARCAAFVTLGVCARDYPGPTRYNDFDMIFWPISPVSRVCTE